jgi:hypothetical protein
MLFMDKTQTARLATEYIRTLRSQMDPPQRIDETLLRGVPRQR